MKRILVPTDFSDHADNALDFAVHLAKKDRGEILLINVFEYPGGASFNTLGVSTYDPLDNVYIDQMMNTIKEKLKERAENPKYGEVIIKYDVVIGNPFSSIASDVRDKQVDIIVMGSKGISGMEGVFVGSNTEKVVRNAKCPVLTVKEKVTHYQVNDIVFATDLQEQQDHLIEELRKLQRLFNARIHVVKINTPGNFESTRKIRDQLETFVKKYKLENSTTNVYDEKHEEEGIIYFAEEINADLIAIGTRGRSAFSQLLSSSIAEDVVNHSKRPIWTCRI